MTFREALTKALMERALICGEGSYQQMLHLESAARLERGEKAMARVADPLVPMVGQDVYGPEWIRMSWHAQGVIVDECVDNGR